MTDRAADLSQLSTEELMRMRAAPEPASVGVDLSGVSTEDLMRMKSAPKKPGVFEDVVKSIPGIVPRAAAALVGIPETLLKLSEAGGRALGLEPARSAKTLPAMLKPGEMVEKGYDEISRAATGEPMHRPQTGPGRVVDTVAQAALSPGGTVAARVSGGAVGSLTGEAARVAGVDNPVALGVLQMLGATVGAMPFILRSVPADSINEAIRNITPQDLAKAQSLMNVAARMGTPLTGAEAIAQVTGKNTLQDIQRVVEASKKGGPVTQQMMNDRPEATRAAVEATADAIAPMPADPSRTPARVQGAADAAITKARQAGNAAAKPDYDTAATQSIPSSDWNAVTQQPAAQKALQAVRQATEYGVSNEREGSIRWLDAAKRWLDAKIQEAPPAERRIWEQGRAAITGAADAASPEYARARATVAANRQNVVNPMQESPVGDLANSRGQFRNAPAEQAMRSQSEILMPPAPRALDPVTIRKTVATINQQDPGAAAGWVRQNVQAIFDEAAQNLSGGANQWGGPKFAAQVAGNPRQRDNLQALVESTSGRPAWVGFNRLLEVLEAHGKRQAPGSQTAFNQQLQSELSASGLGAAGAAPLSPQWALGLIGRAYDSFRFGKNTEEMARILTDPKSVDLMVKLAKEAPHSARAAALTAQVIAGQAGVNSGEPSSTSR